MAAFTHSSCKDDTDWEPNDWVAYVDYKTSEVRHVDLWYNPVIAGLGVRRPPPHLRPPE